MPVLTCCLILYSRSEICAVSQVHLLATLDLLLSHLHLALLRIGSELPPPATPPSPFSVAYSSNSSQLSPPGNK
jgi:hypothetical protein